MDFYIVYTGLTSTLLLVHICSKGALSQSWKRDHGQHPACSGTCFLPFNVCLRLARQSQKTNLCEGFYDHPRFKRLLGVWPPRRRNRGQTRRNRGQAVMAPITVPRITQTRLDNAPNMFPWDHGHSILSRGDGRSTITSTPHPSIQQRNPTTFQRITTKEPERYSAIRRVLQGYHNVLMQRGSSDVTLPPAEDATTAKPETQHTTPSQSTTQPSVQNNTTRGGTMTSQIKAIKDKLGMRPNSTAIRTAVLALHNILLQRTRLTVQDVNITEVGGSNPEPANQTAVDEGWKMSQHLLEMLKLEFVQLPEFNLTASEAGANVTCHSCSDNADCEEGLYCYHSMWCGKQTCQTLHV